MGSINDGISQMMIFIAVWFFRFIFGVFIICQWLTGLLLAYVINPLLDGALDRHDGAVVLLSATLWTGVIGLVFFPLASASGVVAVPPTEWGKAWFGSLTIGCALGMVIGVWVLGEWWGYALRQPPAGYEVVQSLGAPLALTSASPSAPSPRMDEKQQTNDFVSEEEQAHLILGEAVWKGDK